MTIRTKPPGIPDRFLPARLFLDDLEEVVAVLKDEVEKARPGSEPSQVTFEVNDRACDALEELREITPKATNLSIRVCGDEWPAAALTVDKWSSRLELMGFSDEKHLSLYHRLTPIFNRRNRWLPSQFLSRKIGSIISMTLAVTLAVNLPVYLVGALQLKLSAADLIMSTIAAGGLVTVAFMWAITAKHTTIFFRRSSERDARRQELLTGKLLPAAIGSILTFGLTLLGMYLKHKYWP